MRSTVATEMGDSFSHYLAEIRPYTTLTPENEYALLTTVHTSPDAEARCQANNTLIRHNLKLVVKFGKKYFHRADPLDIIQEGNLGLIEAIETFDIDLRNLDGTPLRLSTHAMFPIRQHITRFLNEKHSAIKLTSRTVQEIQAVQSAQHQYENRTGHLPGPRDIAQAVDMEPGEIEHLLLLAAQPVYLSSPMANEDGDEVTYADFLADPATIEPIDYATSAITASPAESLSGPLKRIKERTQIQQMRRALMRLQPEEREVISLLYGIDVTRALSPVEISRYLSTPTHHVSRQIVCQRRDRALEKLRMLLQPVIRAA